MLQIDNTIKHLVIITILVLGVVGLIYIPDVSSADAWHNDSYDKRQWVNITNGSVMDNYPVFVTVTYDSDMQTNFGDIRFYDIKGTQLNYWLHNKTDSTTAWFWVNTSYDTLYTYYKNNTVATGISDSNGFNVFSIFDDWEDGDDTSLTVWSNGTTTGDPLNATVESFGGSNVYNMTAHPDNEYGRIAGTIPTEDHVIGGSMYQINEYAGTSYAARPGTYEDGSNWWIVAFSSHDNDIDAGAVRGSWQGWVEYTASPNPAVANNTWLSFEMVRNDTATTSAIWLSTGKDNVDSLAYQGTITNAVHDVNGSLNLFVARGGVRWDNMYVRKVMLPEPTVAFGSEESKEAGEGLQTELTVSLNNPADDSTNGSTSITFAYTAIDNNASIEGCSLDANWSGSWTTNATNGTTVNNNSQSTFSIINIPEGTYGWTVVCHNDTTYVTATNRTITIETGTPYLISYTLYELSTYADEAAAEVAYGDYDNDGRNEFLYTTYDNAADTRELIVYDPADDSTTVLETFPTAWGSRYVRIFDFDNDGDNDVFVANIDDSNMTMHLFEFDESGRTNHTFATGSGSASAGYPKHTSWFDWDSDGIMEGFTGVCASGQYYTLDGDYDGLSLTQQGDKSDSFEWTTQYDFDGDGTDEVLYQWGYASTNTDTMYIHHSDINASVDLENDKEIWKNESTFGYCSLSREIADLNGDGIADVAVPCGRQDTSFQELIVLSINDSGDVVNTTYVEQFTASYLTTAAQIDDHDNDGDYELFLFYNDQTLNDQVLAMYEFDTDWSYTKTIIWQGDITGMGNTQDETITINYYGTYPGMIPFGTLDVDNNNDALIGVVNYTLPEITPHYPNVTANEDLQLEFTCFDSSGNSSALTIYYEWYMNGSIQPTLNGSILVDNATETTVNLSYTEISESEIWYARVTCSDGYDNSTRHLSQNVTILSEELDIISPTVTIYDPNNDTYSTTTISLNVNSDETEDTWWYLHNNNGTNYTFTPNITIVGTEGQNNITVWANDSTGNEGSDTIYFTVDTTPPTIIIVSPTNISYNTSISISVTTSTADACVYNIGGSNLSLSGGSTSWTETLSTGSMTNGTTYNFIVYCDDVYGNYEMNDSIWFTYSTTDLFYNYSIESPGEDTNFSETDTTRFEIWVYYNVTLYNLPRPTLYFNDTAVSELDTRSTYGVDDGDIWYFKRYIDYNLPQIVDDNEEKTIVWQTRLQWKSNSTYMYFNSTSYNITLYKMVINNTEPDEETIHFIIYDEETDTEITADFEISFDISLDNETERSYPFDLNDSTNYSFYIWPYWAEYFADAVIEYWADGYGKRTWYLDGSSITNDSQTINLYLVASANSSLIQINVKDSEYSGVEDVTIEVQRYYVGSETYKTITILKTDTEGKALTYLIPNEVNYYFILKQDGIIVKTYGAMKIVDDGSTPITVDFFIEGILPEFYEIQEGISGSCVFSELLNRSICSGADTSGLVNSWCIKIEKLGFLLLEEVYYNCTTGSTVTMNYDYGVITDEFKVTFLAHTDDNTYLIDTDSVGTSGSVFYGDWGVFIAILVVLTVTLIGIWNPPIAGIFTVFGLAISLAFGLIALSIASLVGLAIIAALIAMKGRGI